MMQQNIRKEYRRDKQGFLWEVNQLTSTKYPNGMFNWLHLESSWGSTGYVRYDEFGNVIAGNVSLA